MARRKFQMDEDPVEVGVAIKRGFEKTIASRDRPAAIDPGYLLGAAVWWLVAFAGLSIAGMSWVPAAMLSTLLCGFWPVVLLFGR
jgi:hypothetical protein